MRVGVHAGGGLPPWLRWGWLALLGALWLAPPAWAELPSEPQPSRPLRLSAVPLSGGEETVRQFAPLVGYLSQWLGRPVEFRYLSSHEQVLDGLRQGAIDLAYLGPAPYAELVGKGPGQLSAELIVPLARFKEADGKAAYRCALVAFADDRLPLNAAARPVVGMPNALSTCGPLSVRAMLADKGVPWAQVSARFLGNHDQVARAVVAGTVQLGGVREEVALRHASLGLRVLARTEPMPGFVLVAHAGRVPAAALQRLTGLADTPSAEYTRWGEGLRHGLERVSDADFAPVRAMLDKAGRP